MTVDTEKYLDFVEGVTSDPSKDFAQLLRRMTELDVEDDCDVSHLLTAALGLTAEAGDYEFQCEPHAGAGMKGVIHVN